MDYAHKKTDKEIARIEKEIEIIYKKSMEEVKKDLEKVLSKLDLEQDEIKIYHLVMKQKRFQLLLKNMAETLNNSNKTAIDIMNDSFMNTYALNYNWESFNIEKSLGGYINFPVMNKNVVKKLLEKNANAFELMAIDNLKDKTNIVATLRRELLSSLLQGHSIPKIAKKIQEVVEKSKEQSIRIARTETNRVQNVARLDSMKYCEEQGIEVKKRWISTIDTRTRTSHQELNGEEVGLNEEFSNGCICPGEGGSASEVINCRCTMTTEFPNIEKSRKEIELDEELKRMSFEEWQNGK